MLYIKLFIEREKNIGQSAPECPFNMYQRNALTLKELQLIQSTPLRRC